MINKMTSYVNKVIGQVDLFEAFTKNGGKV
jgi:hypothetical protein